MSIVAWLVLGLISGFIASKLIDKTGEGLLLDVALGVMGALLGGFLFNLIRARGMTGFDPWSLLVAIVGALVILGLKHAVIGGHRVGT